MIYLSWILIKGMEKMTYKHILRFLPMIVWMAVIFYLSAQPAEQSSELSTGIMHVLLEFTEKTLVIDDGFFHHIIRKSAHLIAYLLLGILTMFALEHRIKQNMIQILIALLIGVLYAMSDEVHQLFVAGRSGEIADVGIDALGVLIGVLIYILLHNLFHKWSMKRVK